MNEQPTPAMQVQSALIVSPDETRAKVERRATAAQIQAIYTQLARWEHHKPRYVQNLMSKMFGRKVSKVSELTTSEASVLEIHLARIAKSAFNHASIVNNIHMSLNIFLKFSAYPEDAERAKATYRQMQIDTAYAVTEGRTGDFKRLTISEATCYANSLERQLATLEKSIPTSGKA